MTTDTTPKSRPTLWLIAAAILAALSIAILWPLQYVGQVCIMIYPAPPGCGAEEPRWVPFVALGLVVALLATAVTLYFTTRAPRTAVMLLAAGIVVVVALAVAIVWISQTGIWDPYQPIGIIE